MLSLAESSCVNQRLKVWQAQPQAFVTAFDFMQLFWIFELSAVICVHLSLSKQFSFQLLDSSVVRLS